MKKLQVTIEFITDVLGSSPSSETVYRDYVESKSPYKSTTSEEIFLTSVDEVTDKGMTIFPKDKDGRPFFWDYQIRVFLSPLVDSLDVARTNPSPRLHAR